MLNTKLTEPQRRADQYKGANDQNRHTAATAEWLWSCLRHSELSASKTFVSATHLSR